MDNPAQSEMVERLRNALQPFAEIGKKLQGVNGWGGDDKITVDLSNSFDVLERLPVSSFWGALAAIEAASLLPEPQQDVVDDVFALKLLARRERDLGFTNYADWLDAGCPDKGLDDQWEYPREELDDILFYARAAIQALQVPELPKGEHPHISDEQISEARREVERDFAKSELPISGEIEGLKERLLARRIANAGVGEMFIPDELCTEAATALSILQREVAGLRAAMKSALAHRYGEWTTILEDALLQQKEGKPDNGERTASSD